MSKFLLAMLLSVIMNSVGISPGQQSDCNIQFKMAIYPSGSYNETYYFELEDNGMMTAEKGMRTSDDLSTEQYLRSKADFGKGELTVDDVLKIYRLADKVIENDFNDSDYMIKDDWIIQIYYRDETIEETYKSQVSKDIRILVNNFMEISPIDINLHGWS